MSSPVRSTQARLPGLDWLRIGAFALLILYHTGMAFVAWGWHVKVPTPIDWIRWPMLAVNPWRMALIFLVSGWATHVLLRRLGKPGTLLAERGPRLLLPLLFGMLVVVPLQPWVELRSQHGYEPGFLHFLAHDYLRFGVLDGIILPTWNHLWFLAYLLAYTAILAAGLALIPEGWQGRARDICARLLAGPGLWLLPSLWFAAVLLGLGLGLGLSETHALVDDAFGHALFLPVFLAGFMLAVAPEAQQRLAAAWKPLLIVSALAFALRAGLIAATDALPDVPTPALTLILIAKAVQIATMLGGLVGLAIRHGRADHRWRAPLSRAIFPAYIVHQTAIVGLVFALAPLGLPAAATALLTIVGTILACGAAAILVPRLGPAAILLGAAPRSGPSGAARNRPMPKPHPSAT